jgi:protein kinase C substrate 80K-H
MKDRDHHRTFKKDNEVEDLKKPEYSEETQQLIDQFQVDKTNLEELDKELRDIDKLITSFSEKINQETGPNNEFMTFFDKCFEYDDKREYIYKLCPFDKTVQKSKNNNGETTIGHWSRWSDKHDSNDVMSRYMMMHFNEGQACWNGPKRSTNVHLICGKDNQVVSVSEPNRCEYEMKFETPAVCADFKQDGGNNINIHDDL